MVVKLQLDGITFLVYVPVTRLNRNKWVYTDPFKKENN